MNIYISLWKNVDPVGIETLPSWKKACSASETMKLWKEGRRQLFSHPLIFLSMNFSVQNFIWSAPAPIRNWETKQCRNSRICSYIAWEKSRKGGWKREEEILQVILNSILHTMNSTCLIVSCWNTKQYVINLYQFYLICSLQLYSPTFM